MNCFYSNVDEISKWFIIVHDDGKKIVGTEEISETTGVIRERGIMTWNLFCFFYCCKNQIKRGKREYALAVGYFLSCVCIQ